MFGPSHTHLQPLSHAVSVARMQEIDATAIHTVGIPRLLLMEHAGVALARSAQSLVSPPTRPILVCCGTGFNGGDGLSAARHLHHWGYSLTVVVMGSLASLREEPAVYANILRRLGLALIQGSSDDTLAQLTPSLTEHALIIDTLLGIGVRGVVRAPLASVIDAMNRSGLPIVSADIPSGLNGDTGRVQGIAVKATVTVAFGLPKQGCLLQDGPAHVGSLVIDPITIPHTLLAEALHGHSRCAR